MTSSYDKMLSYYPSSVEIFSYHQNLRRIASSQAYQNVNEQSSQSDTKIKKWLTCENVLSGTLTLVSSLSLVGLANQALDFAGIHLLDYTLGISECSASNAAFIEQSVQSTATNASILAIVLGVSEGARLVFTRKNASPSKVSQPSGAIVGRREIDPNDRLRHQLNALKNVKRHIAEEFKDYKKLNNLIEVELAIAPDQCRFFWNAENVKIAQKYLALFMCVKEKVFVSCKLSYTNPEKGTEVPFPLFAMTPDERHNKNLKILRHEILVDMINQGIVTVGVKNSVYVCDKVNQDALREINELKTKIAPSCFGFKQILAEAKL